MPSRVLQSECEFKIPAVEPVPFSDEPGSLKTYPLPGLRAVEAPESRSRPVVTLENEHLRATFVPGIGGRLLELAKAGSSVAEPVSVELENGGPRGVDCAMGLRVSLDPGLDGLAPFDLMVYEPRDEEDPAALMFFSSVPGSGASLQTVYSLPPGSQELLVEARVYNRTLDACPFKIVIVREGSESVLLGPGTLGPRDTAAVRARVSLDGISAQEATTFLDAPAGSCEDTPVESLPLALRGAAHVREAQALTKQGRLREALDSMDSALATLGDDPLAWWHRGVLVRLCGEDDDGANLTMAHALSPLEPVLRAEAFLATPQTHGVEPSAVLKPLAKDVDALHDCVALYVEAGLYQEASRLIDEALRHREQPVLRYVLAWLLTTHTRMEMEAATEVMKVKEYPVQMPYPWRPVEVQAVRDLSQKFPSDQRLQTLARLLERVG